MGGVLLTFFTVFVFPATGIFLFTEAIGMSQRRFTRGGRSTLRRLGRRGGSVKSPQPRRQRQVHSLHADERVAPEAGLPGDPDAVPQVLFVERLASMAAAVRGGGRPGRTAAHGGAMPHRRSQDLYRGLEAGLSRGSGTQRAQRTRRRGMSPLHVQSSRSSTTCSCRSPPPSMQGRGGW